MSPYTLEADIKTSVGGASQGIISWGDFGSASAVNAFRLGDDVLVNYWWGADIQQSTGGVDLSDGSWHHVMATFDGTTRKLYVDGGEIGSDTPTGLAVTKTDNFCVGCVRLLSLSHAQGLTPYSVGLATMASSSQVT